MMSVLEDRSSSKLPSCLTVDVEDWFHILDSSATPKIKDWPYFESRIERNMEKLLTVLDSFSVKATFFWLGWLADRHKNLVRTCRDAGHEIASHGYGHVLAYQVGPKGFHQDVVRAKNILEDILAEHVRGFRSPGFGVTETSPWAFDVIKDSGHQYDSSVFPASRGHGGFPDSLLGPYFIETQHGHLLEIPMSVVKILGRRTTLFGGGYLRLANKAMIKWGIDKLEAARQPLIVYIHPREIDPGQPQLPLTFSRHFKCYVNISTTLPKLKWLCGNYFFQTMLDMVENYIRSFYLESQVVPVMRLKDKGVAGERAAAPLRQTSSSDLEAFRSSLLAVEETMASFLSPALLSQTEPPEAKVDVGS